MSTILLLLISNSFMAYAWYGHLKNPGLPLWQAVLISWGVAFCEYCFLVPANRIGYRDFSVYQLRIIQEAVSLSVFVGFAWLYMDERLKWNHALGFFFLVMAVMCFFYGKAGTN